jgi:outer membrane lipoprotein-sorting protein
MNKKTPKMPGAIAALIAWALLTMGLSAAADDLSARDIMEKNYFVIKVKTLKEAATMTLINDLGESRERKMDIVGKLQPNGVDTNLVIRFQYPPDIKGTGFLQIEHSEGDDNLWIYLPALNKSRRLVANNKKDSFFGSDFSYGDILPPKVDLYRHTLLRSETMDGHDCFVIESVPRDETVKNNSGYGKKITWVRKDSFLESKIEYYDIGGRLLKTQILTQHQQVDAENHRWLAAHREMSNHQTGHKTVFTFSQIDVGKPIADDFFTVRTIEREWRR